MVKEDQSVFLTPLWTKQQQEHSLLNVGPSLLSSSKDSVRKTRQAKVTELDKEVLNL